MASANRNTNRNGLNYSKIGRELERIDQQYESSDFTTDSRKDEDHDKSTTSSSSDSEADPDPQNSKGNINIAQISDSDSDSKTDPYAISNTSHRFRNLQFDGNTDSDNFQNENRSLSDVFYENTLNSDLNETAIQAFQPILVSSPVLPSKFYRQGESWRPSFKRKENKK